MITSTALSFFMEPTPCLYGLCSGFMLENLAKPVILTGFSALSALCVQMENLITSIEIAAAKSMAPPSFPKCVSFENELMRGNRTTRSMPKTSTHSVHSTSSLAHAGIHIKYDAHIITVLTDASHEAITCSIPMWLCSLFSRYPGKHHQFCSPWSGSESGCTQNMVPAMLLRRNGSSANWRTLQNVASLLLTSLNANVA